MAQLQIVMPYGNAYGANHFAYGNGEGDVTLCGRDCYGWSLARRNVEQSDIESAFACKRCARKAKEAA
jgi:hypothetical protein